MLTSSNFKSNKNKQLLVIFSMASLFLFGLTLKTEAKVISVGTTTDTIYMGGSLGVGTTVPGAKLEILSTPISDALYVTNANETAFKLFLKNNGTNNGTTASAFDLGLTYNAVPNSFISFYRGSSSVGGFLTFNTSDAAAGVERMRITGTGNIGIGTTNPSGIFQVYSVASSTTGLYVSPTGLVGIGTAGPQTGFKLDVNGQSVLRGDVYNSGNLIEFGSGAYQLSSSGNSWLNKTSGSLGIGLTNPGTKLDVSGTFRNSLATTHSLLAGSGNVVVMADNTGALYTVTQASLLSGATNFWGGTKNGTIWNGDTGAGTVGIGTTNTNGTKLFIDSDQGTTNNAALKIIYQGATTVLGEVAALAHRNSQWSGLYVNGTGSSLTNAVFVEGNKPVIFNAGNVGIGATNPVEGKLHIIQSANTNAGGIALINSGNTRSTRIWTDTNGTRIDSGASSDGVISLNGAGTGNVGVGTAAPRGKLDVGGFFTTNYISSSANWTGAPTDQFIPLGTFNANSNVRVILNLSGCSFGDSALEYMINKGYNGVPRVYFMGANSYGTMPRGLDSLVAFHYENISTTSYYLGVNVSGGCNDSGRMVGVTMSVVGGANFTATDAVKTNYTPLNAYQYIYNGYEGSVGIGMTNPGTKLDISGTLRNSTATTHSLLGGSGNVVVMADNTGTLYNTPLATFASTNSLWGGTKNGNIWNGDAGVGNVGIGTTAPNEKLQVIGNAQFGESGAVTSATHPIQVRNSSDSFIDLVYSSLRTWDLGIDSGANFFIRDVDGGNSKKLVIDTSGNVGIGTTNPGAKLEVAGDIKSTVSGASALFTAYNPGTNYPRALFKVGNSASDVNTGLMFAPEYTASGVTKPFSLEIYNNKLNADASARMVGLGVYSTYASIHSLGPNGNSAGLPLIFSTQTYLGNNPAVYISNAASQNVGIGTTAPGTKLDISGTFRNSLATTHSLLGAAGNVVVMADNTGTLYSTPLATFASTNSLWGGTKNGTIWNGDSGVGSIGVGTTAPMGKMDVVNSTGNQYGDLIVRADNAGGVGGKLSILNFGGGANTAAVLAFGTDTSTLFDASGANANNAEIRAVNNGLSGNSADLQFSNWSGAGENTNMVIRSNGNVGIGMTAPNAKLQVGSGTTNSPLITMGSQNSEYDMMGNISTNEFAMQPYTYFHVLRGYAYTSASRKWNAGDYALTIDNANMQLLPFGGNVGIGTNNPLNKLQISSTGYTGNDFVVGSSNGSVAIHNNSGNSYVYGSQRLDLLASGVGMTILTNGNVGVGNTNPGNRLIVTKDLGSNDVSGSQHALQFQIEKTTQDGGCGKRSLGIGVMDDGNSVLQSKQCGVGYNNLLLNPVSGNVGIGNTAPGTKLDVSGTFRNSLATTHSLLAGSGNVVVMADNAGTLYTSTAASSLLWSGSTGGDIWNSNTGNIGIGLTNPGAKLDVNGSSFFRSIDRIGPAVNNPERGPWNPIWSSIGAGRAVYADEEFENGTNSLYVYNNSGGDGVQHFWENGDGSQPNRSGKWIRIYDNGNATSPGWGGFYQTIACRRNATLVQRFRAKLPVGYSFVLAENSQGANNTSYWLTSTSGTGKWEEYIRVSHCGNTGSFAGGGHVYVTGGTAPFTWYVASSNIYEIDSPPGIFSGSVGIGKNNPAVRLDVAGDISASMTVNATGLCIGGVCKTDWNSLVPIAGNVTLTGPLTIPGLSLTGDLDLTWHNIRNVTKLSVGTIDPLYNIHGVNYATFASSVAGGVKEEYIGKAKINSKNAEGEYEFVVDFDTQKEGSDLWVWRHAVDFSDDNVQVLITPSGQKADIYYVIHDNKITLKSDKAVSASYHLIGNRIDWKKWPTRAVDQNETPSFIIK